MANAHFKLGTRTIEVFGPRMEQIAHLLELDGDKVARHLQKRIASHVADGERGEHVLSLDAGEQDKMLKTLDRIAAASKSMPADLDELRGALS